MKELQRLYNRAVPVFDTYKRVQTKYLQNLTDLPHDPIEFSLKNPPADESKLEIFIILVLSLYLVLDSKVRIQSLTQKDVKMIEDKNTVLNRRQEIRERSLNRKPHSTGLELAILPDPVNKTSCDSFLTFLQSPTNIRKYRNGLFGFNGYRNEGDGPPEIESNLEDDDDSERSSPPRKRFKRGRPFVQGIEERINSGCRPGIFKVEKQNQDSGIRIVFYSIASELDDIKSSIIKHKKVPHLVVRMNLMPMIRKTRLYLIELKSNLASTFNRSKVNKNVLRESNASNTRKKVYIFPTNPTITFVFRIRSAARKIACNEGKMRK